MKKIYLTFIILAAQIANITYFSGAFAQETLLEKIRERKQERRQWIINKLTDKNITSAREHSFNIKHNGLLREYKVYVPKNYDKDISVPVVIYLHGGGGNMLAAYKDGMDKMSDKFGFILAIPAGKGKKILGKTIGSWNSGNWSGWSKINSGFCCGYAGENNIDDVGFISKMIDEIKKNYTVDETRIYATGISNGGMLSYRLACELSNKIAAVAPVAPPFVPEVCSSSSGPISIIHIHGTADPCALYEGGYCDSCLGSKPISAQSAKDMVNSWAIRNGCPAESKIVYNRGNTKCVIYSKCEQGTEVEFCTIEGGGHTWPSGSQYLPAKKIGPVSYDISFDQIWEFFKNHSLNSRSQI